MKMRLLSSGAIFALAIIFGPPAYGQTGLEDKKQGRRLAKSLCVNCHDVSPEGRSTSSEAVPSFHDMANQNGQSREQLAGRIVIPHPEMPTIPLTRSEIRDIVAYIMSLKEAD